MDINAQSITSEEMTPRKSREFELQEMEHTSSLSSSIEPELPEYISLAMPTNTNVISKGKRRSIEDTDRQKRQLFQHMMVTFPSEKATKVKKVHRYATKTGLLNISYTNLPGLNRKLFKDMFHTIMDAKWRYFMLLFTMSFLVTWVLFAAVWYLIISVRTEICVDNVDSFATAFLFSLETQVTIGYGGRAVTDKCPEAVLLLIIQTIIGTFINCALLGVLFAKLARPKNRGKTIVFAQRAIITLRDGKYCFIFRYVDLRERKLLDSNMRLVIIKPRMTKEGHDVPLDMMDMAVTIDYKQVEFTMRLFPIYPISIIHIIDEDSPLYTMTKQKIDNAEFEILAILEGTVPGTGNTTQALTSYKSKEIEWGSRFTPIYIGMRKGHTTNCIDLSTLDHTYDEQVTPNYSAKEHDIKKKEAKKKKKEEEKRKKKEEEMNTVVEIIIDDSESVESVESG